MHTTGCLVLVFTDGISTDLSPAVTGDIPARAPARAGRAGVGAALALDGGYGRADRVPERPPAARAPRPAVLWRKGSFGFDSEARSQYSDRLLTVAATYRQQGRPLLGFLVAAVEAALRGSSPPSLLPVGQGG